ncbi:MAG: DNA cytosine methyltransferase [Candidatus Poribacteria bacterium]|nr:DNA cytosine methyltransferase [Candidatus Poribacteria bacterium]
MSQLSFSDFLICDPKQPELSWHEEILSALGIKQSHNWIDKFGTALRAWSIANVKPIRTLSLFTGGGGLDIGFHDAGFQIVEMVEIKEKYVRTLAKNTKDQALLAGSKPLCMDIRDFYPDSDLKVDFVIGGPPCQTFSAAGRRAAGVTGIDDPRGTLFEEYVRILKAVQPKGFLFENVYGIVGAQKGEAWRQIQESFQQVGYKIYFRILDSADYGVPQHRERLFIVGLMDGEFLFPRPTHGDDAVGNIPHYSAQDAIVDVDTSGVRTGLSGEYGHLLNNVPPGLNYSFYTEKLGHPEPVFAWRAKFSDFLYKADPEKPVRTIKAQGGQYTGPFSWENRPFTVTELKRLQTFPDEYEIVGNRHTCIEQIGNSVPPQMARMLALAIIDQSFKIRLPFRMHYLQQHEVLGFRKRKRALTDVYREKARLAINQAYPDKPHRHFKRGVSVETRYITPNFEVSSKRLEDSKAVFFQYAIQKNKWTISGNSKNKFDEFVVYETVIRPRPEGNWLIPTEKVILRGYNTSPLIFTGLWKAFEDQLKLLTGVADLVQLCGYYQYTPKIVSQFVCKAQGVFDSFWQRLQLIVNGIGVSTQISQSELSQLLNLDSKDVLTFLEWLKKLGYEVRNHNTNPQLPKNTYLIPYTFPTLTPRSVQLRKSLRGKYE